MGGKALETLKNQGFQRKYIPDIIPSKTFPEESAIIKRQKKNIWSNARNWSSKNGWIECKIKI